MKNPSHLLTSGPKSQSHQLALDLQTTAAGHAPAFLQHIQIEPNSVMGRFGKPWSVNWAMAVSCLQQLSFVARQEGLAVHSFRFRPVVGMTVLEAPVFTGTLDHSTQLDTLLVAAIKPVWRLAAETAPEVMEWQLEFDLVSLRVQAAEWGLAEDQTPEDADYAPDLLALDRHKDFLWQKYGHDTVGMLAALPQVDPFRLAS